MAVATEKLLKCVYCGEAIVPPVEHWHICDGGPIHDDCWREFQREMRLADADKKRESGVA